MGCQLGLGKLFIAPRLTFAQLTLGMSSVWGGETCLSWKISVLWDHNIDKSEGITRDFLPLYLLGLYRELGATFLKTFRMLLTNRSWLSLLELVASEAVVSASPLVVGIDTSEQAGDVSVMLERG